MSGLCNRCLETGGEVRMWGTVHWCRECAVNHGGVAGRRAVALLDIGTDAKDFTPHALQRLADAGIMDTNALFLPAGRISLAETEARERAGMERLA